MQYFIVLQTLAIALLGRWLVGSWKEAIIAAMVAAEVARLANAHGVPWWTGSKFGDAYDFAVVVFFALCYLRSVRVLP